MDNLPILIHFKTLQSGSSNIMTLIIWIIHHPFTTLVPNPKQILYYLNINKTKPLKLQRSISETNSSLFQIKGMKTKWERDEP